MYLKKLNYDELLDLKRYLEYQLADVNDFIESITDKACDEYNLKLAINDYNEANGPIIRDEPPF